MFSLPRIIPAIQEELFPELINKHDMILTPEKKQLIYILETVQVEKYCRPSHSLRMGRPSLSRQALARAFIIRYVYNLPTTECMVNILKGDRDLQRICGYSSANDIPSLSTFSRAFKEFSKIRLCDLVSDALLSSLPEDPTLTHISIDSTAIEARENPTKQLSSPIKRLNIDADDLRRVKNGSRNLFLLLIDREHKAWRRYLLVCPRIVILAVRKVQKGKCFFGMVINCIAPG